MKETVHESARGTLRLQLGDSGLLIGKVVGHYGVDLLASYVDGMNAAARAGRVVAFHDWEEMETYDSECRKVMTDWTLRHRHMVERGHILVRSKLVSMGVTTASLLIGSDLIVTYTQRAEFEAVLRPHLHR